MTWSTDPEALFGFPAGAFGPELRIFARRAPRGPVRVEARDCGGAGDAGIYECEYRAVRPDGGVVWITERGRVFSDADGERGWSASVAT